LIRIHDSSMTVSAGQPRNKAGEKPKGRNQRAPSMAALHWRPDAMPPHPTLLKPARLRIPEQGAGCRRRTTTAVVSSGQAWLPQLALRSSRYGDEICRARHHRLRIENWRGSNLWQPPSPAGFGQLPARPQPAHGRIRNEREVRCTPPFQPHQPAITPPTGQPPAPTPHTPERMEVTEKRGALPWFHPPRLSSEKPGPGMTGSRA